MVTDSFGEAQHLVPWVMSKSVSRHSHEETRTQRMPDSMVHGTSRKPGDSMVSGATKRLGDSKTVDTLTPKSLVPTKVQDLSEQSKITTTETSKTFNREQSTK